MLLKIVEAKYSIKELVNFIFMLPVIFMLPSLFKKISCFSHKIVTVFFVLQDNNAHQF